MNDKLNIKSDNDLHNKGKDLYDNAREVFEQGKQKTEDVMHKTKDKAQENMHEWKDKADSLYQHAKDSAADACAEGKKMLHDWQNSFSGSGEKIIAQVKEKPLTSLLLAAGIGFILSALTKK